MKRSVGPMNTGFPTPVFIVGTYDAAGKANMAAVAWGGICCSKPACVNVSLRKATYTHGAIVARQAFTVCIPSQSQVASADYFGLASGRDTDKIANAGLTAVRAEHVDAPYLAEFPVALECKLVHTAELGLHTMFVGEVLDAKVDESAIGADGKVSLDKIRPFVYSPPCAGYYAFGQKIAQGFSEGKSIAARNVV